MTELVKQLLLKAGLHGQSGLYNFIQIESEEPTCLPIRVTAWGISEQQLIAQVWGLQKPVRDLLKPISLRYNEETRLFELIVAPLRNDSGKRVKGYLYHGRLFDDDKQRRINQVVLHGGIV